ncbi:excisionase family DNA binding protein [Catenulispora sp. GP43]|uniref:helix-turn-helix domain-containing protein n=1 Tax=Catenulispora sp. GP43 TaxID=3156263 RepID=UPI0035151D59
MTKDAAWTLDNVLALPPVLTLETAASILGIGRTLAYTMAADDRLPVPVFRVGTAYRVPTAPLLRFLGIDAHPLAPQTPAA